MEALVITGDRAEVVPIAALPAALADPEAIVWVDVPDLDEEALGVLRDVFGFHPVTIWECKQRQRMPKFHPYADHVFVVLHSPELGEHGHVHYVELDQFIAAQLPGHRPRPDEPGRARARPGAGHDPRMGPHPGRPPPAPLSD